jgi:hypothetical protein
MLNLWNLMQSKCTDVGIKAKLSEMELKMEIQREDQKR